MFPVHNEQTKLTATWLNALATALMAAGTFAPIAALFYGFANSNADQLALILGAGVCFVVGIGLHLAGRLFLRRLRT